MLATERRITLRLLAYWEKLRAGRDMPAEGDVRPDDIADLWNSCFMVHIDHIDDPDYHYSYIGDNIIQAWVGELDRGDASHLVSPSAKHLCGVYSDMMASPKPIVQEGEFVNLSGHTVRFRQCFLPLGSQGRVSAVLGGMRFKLFSRS